MITAHDLAEIRARLEGSLPWDAKVITEADLWLQSMLVTLSEIDRIAVDVMLGVSRDDTTEIGDIKRIIALARGEIVLAPGVTSVPTATTDEGRRPDSRPAKE
jgi:hypothetical protein